VHTVGVRAEHVQLVEAAGAPLRGRVQRIERLSDQYLLHLRLNDTDTELIVSAPPEQLAHAGQEVGIHIVQSLWFDAAGLRVRG
jgi:ABC-type sugar transport system ATPase subunit